MTVMNTTTCDFAAIRAAPLRFSRAVLHVVLLKVVTQMHLFRHQHLQC